MKKVVLLGDSIRLMGYGAPVEEALKEDFEVWQPKENCRFAQYTLRGIFDWREQLAGADIIHWNNGLWDVCSLFGDGLFTPTEIYVEEMVRLAKLLKQRAKVVIFATTTPVRNENLYNKNADIARFNEVLVPRLQALGVEINDLYTPLSKDIPRYICDDLIHLSQDGIDLCAGMVEASVRRAAEHLVNSEKSCSASGESNHSGAPV